MLRKTESDTRTFLFDFSNILSEGDGVLKIHDIRLEGDISIGEELFIDDKSVLLYIYGGESGKSYEISVLVITEIGDVLEIKDFIVVSDFDFDSSVM